jgi:hypothetical protein
MRLFAGGAVVTALIGSSAACGGNSITSPTPPTTITLGFDAIRTDGAAVTTYTEATTRVTATTGNWTTWTRYGNPAPFIQFFAPGGTRAAGALRVSPGGPFRFTSVDLYSSTTPIP